MHCLSGNELECYFCFTEEGNDVVKCDSENYGIEITCQMENEKKPYYGDSCVVGHTCKFNTSKNKSR